MTAAGIARPAHRRAGAPGSPRGGRSLKPQLRTPGRRFRRYRSRTRSGDHHHGRRSPRSSPRCYPVSSRNGLRATRWSTRCGRQRRKEDPLKRLGYFCFYRLLSAISDLDIPLDSGDFCLMDRRVVDVLKHLPKRCGSSAGCDRSQASVRSAWRTSAAVRAASRNIPSAP